MGKAEVRARRAARSEALVESWPLPLTAEHDAVVTPITHGEGHGRRVKSEDTGAVYGGDGALVAHSQRILGSERQFRNPPTIEGVPPARRIEGDALFGGMLFRNFGHVLLEGTSRLWAVEELGARPAKLVYQCYTPDVAPRIAGMGADSYFAILLRAAGYSLDDVELVTDAPVAVERLAVPQASFALNHGAHPRFVSVFDRVLADLGLSDGPAGASPKKVYFSRRLLASKKRRALNEDEIEAEAERLGYTVIHSQELSFPDQVACVRGADVIAGCDGSALHLAIFARAGTGVLSFDTRHSLTQPTINALRGLDGRRVRPFREEPEKDAARNRLTGWHADLDLVREGLAAFA